MSYEKIRVEPILDGAGRRVLLAAPKANILDGQMMTELGSLLDECAGRPELKLLCFAGEGAHFSFGASVPDHVADRAPAMLAAFHGLFLKLADLAVPTVAAVRGRCLGGGMELAAFCNRVVAASGAVFAQPEIQLAVLPPVASLILPLKLGQSRADEINLTGRDLPAEEALEWGLVDQMADDPVAAAEAWAAEHLVKKSAAALRCAVRASRWRWNQVLREDLKRLEAFYLDELMATHDAGEGLAAFMEKRRPEWTDR